MKCILEIRVQILQKSLEGNKFWPTLWDIFCSDRPFIAINLSPTFKHGLVLFLISWTFNLRIWYFSNLAKKYLSSSTIFPYGWNKYSIILFRQGSQKSSLSGGFGAFEYDPTEYPRTNNKIKTLVINHIEARCITRVYSDLKRFVDP